jgi:Family of unknown function (DUF6298)
MKRRVSGPSPTELERIDGIRYGSRGPASHLVVLAALTVVLMGSVTGATGATIGGPLRVSADNPRYFATPDGTIVYLAGAHTWNNLIDMDDKRPPHRFDFDAYLRFLEAHHHNFFRLWAWELPAARSKDYVRRQYAEPQPWLRTGPGEDITGLPRFDLTKPNEAYFSRLRERVAAAAAHRIYVSVMLFEGWGAQFAPGKSSHPFNRRNNINGIDYGEDPRNIYTLKIPQITAIQDAYVRRVVDTVDEFDNVLYEIVNEAGTYSTAWQAHMIDLVRRYEAGKPKQHPIGMTSQYPGGNNATLFASDVDWISPNAGPADTYWIDPGPAEGRKVIVLDTDHLGGSSTGTRDWVWRSFTRGMNMLYMDLYTAPDSVSDPDYYYDYDIRTALGDTRLIAQLLRLRNLVPRPELASTRYVLGSDETVVVYQPAIGPFWVDLSHLVGPFTVEWFDTVTGNVKDGSRVSGGANVELDPPFLHPTLVLLRSTSSYRPRLASIEPAAKRMRNDALRYLRWSSAVKQRFRNWLAVHAPVPGAREFTLTFVAGFVAGIGAIGALVLLGWTIIQRRRRSGEIGR